MKRKFSYLMVVVGALSCASFSDIDLQEQLSSKGARAVGLTVKEKVAGIYAGDSSSRAKRKQISGVLDEVAATDNEDAIRYSVVATLLAGGNENLDTGSKVVEKQLGSGRYKGVALRTLSETVALMTGESPEPVVAETIAVPVPAQIAPAPLVEAAVPVVEVAPVVPITAADASAAAAQAVRNARVALAEIEKTDDQDMILTARKALRKAEAAASRAEGFATKEALARARNAVEKSRAALVYVTTTGNSELILMAKGALENAEKAEAEAIALAAKNRTK